MSEFKYTQNYNAEEHLEEIICTIPQDVFEANFDKALDKVVKTTTLKGFRPGKAPKAEVMKSKYQDISNEAINLSIDYALKNITELTPRPLEPLNIKTVEVDDSKNLKIIFNYLPMPEVKVPSFDGIKVKEIKPTEVTEEEVNNELKNVWFHYAGKDNKDLKKDEFTEDKLDEKFFEETDIKNDNPEIKNLQELKNYLKDYVSKTYASQAQMNWENEVFNEVLNKAEFDKVDGLIDRELNKRVEDYKSKFTQIGMNADDYMKKSNISEDDLKKDWIEQVERDVKLEMLLQKYGEENKIEPTEEEMKDNIENLDPQTKENYKNDENHLKSLIKYYYINQKSYSDIIDKIKENGKKGSK